MSAALGGRRTADLLQALHDEHAHALFCYVVGLTNGDRGKAQDVVQETLLRAWRNPAVLDGRAAPDGAGCSPWRGALSSTNGALRATTVTC